MKKFFCLSLALMVSAIALAQVTVFKSMSMFDFTQIDDSDDAKNMVIATLGGLGTTVISYDESTHKYKIVINIGEKPLFHAIMDNPVVAGDKKVTFKATDDGDVFPVTVTPKKVSFENLLDVDLMEDDKFPQLVSFVRGKSKSTTSVGGIRTKPQDLDLAIRRNGKTYYVNTSQWSDLPAKDTYEIVGIVLMREGYRFIVAWNDEYDKVQYTDWRSAITRYGSKIPTKELADIIQNCTNLRDVAVAYGADNYGNWYWTRTSCPGPDSNSAYIFCPGIPDVAYDRAEKKDSIGVLLIYPIPGVTGFEYGFG